MSALSVKETMERFQMGHETVMLMFRRKGSPAYKVAPGKTASWRVDEDEFKEYLKSLSEPFKG